MASLMHQLALVRLAPHLLMSSLLSAVLLLAVVVGAEAATTLSIVIAGEPWKDPSISSVGTKLTISKPPTGGTFALGWSTTAGNAMGISWQVKKLGAPSSVVLSGKAPLTKAAVPGTTNWFWIDASFLAKNPPSKPTDFQIVITPYDAKQKPIGTASAPVTVTQVADKGPGPIFGRSAVFPTIHLMRYQEQVGSSGLGQLESAVGSLKLRLTNDGQKPTDPMWLLGKDAHVLMHQQSPLAVPSLLPGHSLIVTLNLTAVLPPAQSQLPDEQQIREWKKEYKDRGGVDFSVAMDWRGPEASAPISGHSEVKVYKGSGDSCANGILDGDEEMIPDCGGSCGCCFGKDVWISWWRAVYGFQFDNSDAFLALTGKYDLGDIQGVFGDCAIYINCPFLPVPSPFALGYLSIVKVAIDGNGRCFGFSLAALSFLHGDESLSKYPMVGSGCDTWHLASPLKQDSQDLSRLIKRKHLYQMSNQVWQAYIETRAAASPGYWLQQLKSNLPAMLSLCGHVVIVIAISDDADGTTHLNLYDPNVPFAPNEASQIAVHKTALGQSTIKLSGGNYTFDDGHGETCQGSAASEFTVFPYSSLSHPTMPSDPSSLVAFGGAVKGATVSQVTDASGHRLFLADGSINRDPATRVRAYPFHPLNGASDGPVRFIVADAKAAHTHTIVPSGDYEMIFLGPNYMVHIDEATGIASDADQLTIDPEAAGFELETKAANKLVHTELTVGAADKSIRRAAAHITLSSNKKVRLEFDAQRDTVSYRHQGAAFNLELELWSSLNPKATVRGRPVAVEDGDALTIKPDWARIDQVAGVLRHVKRDGTVRELPLR